MFNIAFDIRDRKIKNNNKTLSQSLNNANKIFDRQQSKQTFAKKLTNKLNFQVENNANTLLFCNNNKVDYAKLVVKERAKTKNLKIKKKYLILQKRNKRLQKSMRDKRLQKSI